MLLSILILIFAFGVLLSTFFWISRLLAARGQREVAAIAPATVDAAPIEETGPTPEEEAAEELERTKTGVGVNATLGLILSVLACLLFWLSPLTLVLSVAGLWFSGNALWFGFRRFNVFIGRAALGIILGAGSFGLQFGYLTGQFTLPF